MIWTDDPGASEAEILRLQFIYEELKNRNLENAEVTATEILIGLGFDKTMIQSPTNTLSGGWRMRFLFDFGLKVEFP